MFEKLNIHHVDGVETINLKDFDNIVGILVRVISGDETVFISYNDGEIKFYDPYERMRSDNSFEGQYYIYRPAKGINRIEEFNNEKDSHTILDKELFEAYNR